LVPPPKVHKAKLRARDLSGYDAHIARGGAPDDYGALPRAAVAAARALGAKDGPPDGIVAVKARPPIDGKLGYGCLAAAGLLLAS
jgi:hypothetical protein